MVHGKYIKYFFSLLLSVLLLINIYSCSAEEGGTASAGEGTSDSDGAKINVTRNSTPIYSGNGPYQFGNVLTGESSSPITFTITNSGTETLTVKSVSLTGENASEFSDDFSGETVLAAGETLDILVTFSPTTTTSGNRYAQLNITHTDSTTDSPFIVLLSGYVTISAAEIAVVDSANATVSSNGDPVFLGTIDENGGTLTKTLTIKNLGNGTLNVSGISGASLPFGSDSPNTILSARGESGDSVTFDVTFTPTSSGYFTDQLIIANSDDDEDPYYVNISGTAAVVGTTSPEINVKIGSTNYESGVGSYDFGDVRTDLGTNPSVTVTVQNLGTANLTLTAPGDTGRFFVGGSVTSPLSAGTETTFTVTYDPNSTANDSEILSIINDDLDEGTPAATTYQLTFEGHGIEPDIRVYDVANGGNITDGTSNYTFLGETIEKNTSGTVRTLRIYNDGEAPLDVGGVSFVSGNTTQFKLLTVPSSTIASGGSYSTFTIQYAPTTDGTHSLGIQIDSDDPDSEDPYNFTLTNFDTTAQDIDVTVNGTGVADSATTGSADYTYPASVDVGNNDLIPVVIENTGGSTLGSLSASISGTGDITFSGGAPTIPDLEPGETYTFNLKFEPTVGGAHLVVLTINSDDPDTSGLDESEYLIEVGGTGVGTPVMTFSGTTDFGSTVDENGGSQMNELTITNTGTADLSVTGITIDDTDYTQANWKIDSSSVSAPSVGTPWTIPVGKAATVEVTFDPDGVSGNRNTTMHLVSPDVDDQDISLTATAIAPNITVISATTDFGDVDNDGSGGTLQTYPYEIENTGSAALNISAITPTSGEFYVSNISPTLGTDINTGGSCTFDVTFDPVNSTNGITDTITITSDAINADASNNYEIDVTGNGIALVPVIDTVPADGGNLNLGTDVRKDESGTAYLIGITNNGTIATTDTLTQVSLSDSTHFTLTDSVSGTSIDTGVANTVYVSVVFTPQSTGSHSTTLRVSIDNNVTYESTITLAGTCVEPNVGTILIDGSGTTPHDFGDYPADGGTSGALALTIDNSGGTAPLSVTSVEITGTDKDDFVLTGPATLTVPTGNTDSSSYTVAFTPATMGSGKSATLTVHSDDDDEPDKTIGLEGDSTTLTGADIDGATAPTFNGYSNPVFIGAVDNTATITFWNNSDAEDNLQVAYNGITGSDFTCTGGPLDISPGGSGFFTITFNPSSPGLSEETVTFDLTNEPDYTTYTVDVSGEGTGLTSVDATDSVGAYLSMDIDDDDDNVFIAYHDTTNGNLKFATSSDSGGAINDAGVTWDTSASPLDNGGGTNDVGTYTALKSDGADNVYIAYRDETAGSLKFIRSGDDGANWDASVTIDSSSDTGYYPSVTTDGTYVYVAYYCGGDGFLYLATSTDTTGASWASKKLVKATVGGTAIEYDGTNLHLVYSAEESYASVKTDKPPTFDLSGGGGDYYINVTVDGILYEDINLGSANPTTIDNIVTAINARVPAGAVYNYNDSFLELNELVAGGAGIAVDNSTTAPSALTLVFDSTGTGLSDASGSTYDLVYMKSTDSGVSWTPTVLDSTGVVGASPSLVAYDDGSLIHIMSAYYDTTNSKIKFIRSDDGGSSWNSAVSLVSAEGAFCSMDIISDLATYENTPFVYYNTTTTSLDFDWSEDLGVTTPWGYPVTIDNTTSANVGKYAVIKAFSEKIYYVAYFDSVNGDLLFAKTVDEGVNW